VQILEQPSPKSLRFRYECEGRSTGALTGLSSTNEKKTFPKIQVLSKHGIVGECLHELNVFFSRLLATLVIVLLSLCLVSRLSPRTGLILTIWSGKMAFVRKASAPWKSVMKKGKQ